MKFLTIPAHEALRPFIRNYWHLRSMATGDGIQRIMSNGAVSLHFYRAQPIRFGDDSRWFTSSLNVQDIKYMDLVTKTGSFEVLGVEFMPFGARLFFDESMSACSGMHLKPEDLNDPAFCELEERIMEAIDPSQCYRFLDEFFLHKLMKTIAGGINVQRLQGVFRLAEGSLVTDESTLTPSTLADKACLSPKQFTRIFHEYVGINPKSYLRILRCHAAILALQEKAMSADSHAETLTEIAWRCGYYDLSHMTSDFMEINGSSPSQIIETVKQRAPHPILSQAFQPSFSQVLKKLIRIENLV